jgi:glucosamine-6-phosphate deaminase
MDVLSTSQEGRAEFLAAGIIAQALRAKPDLVLGLATGRTMDRVYLHLAGLHREDGLDFSQCRTFNLDAYLGLPPDHPGSYHRYMEEHLFQYVNVNKEHCHMPNGMASDVAMECLQYERLIQEAGGLDLLLLGLGLTGHIGFNEPGTAFESRTHETQLTELTRNQNAGPFGGMAAEVPTTAITIGLGTIMESKRCLLLVKGAAKASVLARVVEGPITPLVPGSVLQWHSDCWVIADRAASAELGKGPADPA